jgi:hypothetical protein
VSPVTTAWGKGSIYDPMSATDSPPGPPSPLDMSRVLRWSSEDIRQDARTLRQRAHRLIESNRELRHRLRSFLNRPPPTQSA